MANARIIFTRFPRTVKSFVRSESLIVILHKCMYNTYTYTHTHIWRLPSDKTVCDYLVRLYRQKWSVPTVDLYTARYCMYYMCVCVCMCVFYQEICEELAVLVLLLLLLLLLAVEVTACCYLTIPGGCVRMLYLYAHYVCHLRRDTNFATTTSYRRRWTAPTNECTVAH